MALKTIFSAPRLEVVIGPPLPPKVADNPELRFCIKITTIKKIEITTCIILKAVCIDLFILNNNMN